MIRIEVGADEEVIVRAQAVHEPAVPRAVVRREDALLKLVEHLLERW